ncbi:hypothetical protein TRFO_37587 [Tritrichomonas foetus]|uniref:Uncharacterized protein n=1 Tax=Tritrichomonas foetus TaxID=1144522 RepID=A0A1J4JC68_9EUKA|nr:hypothetical protein TRFO_37587 [Tritrichomonas foetus]|eukprot:OHS96257.1 hypothetical protein TRFO_37587 [Tritrichomonas foetus]
MKSTLNLSIVNLLDSLDKNPGRIPDVNKSLEILLQELKQEKDRPMIHEVENIAAQEPPKKPQKERFEFKKCEAFKQITEVYFYPTIRQSELVSISTVLANACELRVDRDAKRRKDLLYKWFEDHWDQIEPHLKHLIAFNKEGDVLNRNGKNHPQDSQQQDEGSPDQSLDNNLTVDQ